MAELSSAPSCSSPQWDLDSGGGVNLHCWNNVYVVSVDLRNPEVEVRPAEVYRPNPLSSVADGDTIAVINGDYTDSGCNGTRCAQGLFYIAGEDKTNHDKLCRDALKRRVLALSADGRPLIDWWYAFISNPQSLCPQLVESGGWATGYRYHVVSGGPQITFDGSFRWDCAYGRSGSGDCNSNGSEVVINEEHFGTSAANWWNRNQTIVGYTTDGNRLLLAVTNGAVNPQGVHDVLWQVAQHHGQTLKNAIKYDGGSVSGLYYRRNPTYSINPNVPVANAWVVRRRTAPPPPPPPPPSGNWHVEYFSDRDLRGRCYEGYEDSTYIFKKWDDGSPAAGCPGDNFSARFTRRVNFQGGNYSFHLEHDDGARLFVDGQNVIDAWWDGAGGHDGVRNLSGEHEVKIEYYESGGFAGLGGWWYGSGALPDAPANDPGQWRADYYPNRDLWGRPPLVLNEGGGFLDHRWGNDGPGYGLPSDNFSARWLRTVAFACGRYRFNVRSDDGVRLWVGSQRLLDEWRPQVAEFHPEIDLPAGNATVKVEFFEAGGEATIHVDWQQLSSCAQPPRADFDAWPLSGNAPLTVAMHNTSTGDFTSCRWEYGDGQTGTSCGAYHDHVYTTAGVYTVRLTVTGPGGSDTKERSNYITVNAAPPPCTPGANGVVLYEHPNYTGRCITFTGDDDDFNNDNFNDMASSIRFVGSYASGWEAQLYEHTYYGGVSSTFRGDDPDFGNDTIGHDRASSIHIRRSSTDCPGQYRAEYYNNRTLGGTPTFTRCENWPINHDWGNGGPGNGVGDDNFSARWTGRANISAGTYTFIAQADDGIRVWLGNERIIDAWRDQPPTEYRVTRSLSAGQYEIKVEYYENAGGAVARFRWEAADTTAPTGSFTEPASEAQVNPPVWLRVQAQDDPGGSGMAKVRFTSNGTGQWRLIFEDSAPPYEVQWDMAGVPVGQRFMIGAELFDRAGNYRGIVRWITRQGGTADTTAPTGSFTAPAPGARVSPPVWLRVQAQDNPGGSGMARVRFTSDCTGQWRLIFEDTAPPYEVLWDMAGVPVNRECMIGAELHDNAGNYRGIVRRITRLPAGPLCNGDFEQGPNVCWQEYSTHGWPIIFHADDLPIAPRSSNWAAWLGGEDDEISAIWQQVNIPTSNPILSFWYWIASADECGYDFGGVIINASTVADVFDLCASANTNGWVQRTVDLRSYAGQSVELEIRAETDESLNSNLFVDDVALGTGSEEQTVTSPDVVGPSAPELMVDKATRLPNLPRRVEQGDWPRLWDKAIR